MLAQTIQEHDFQHLNVKLTLKIILSEYDKLPLPTTASPLLTASRILSAQPLVSIRIPIMRDTTIMGGATEQYHNDDTNSI